MPYTVVVSGELTSKGRPPRWVPPWLRRPFTWTRRWPVDWTIDLPIGDGQLAEVRDVGPFTLYLVRSGFMFELGVRLDGRRLTEVRVPVDTGGMGARAWSFDALGQSGRGTVSVEATP